MGELLPMPKRYRARASNPEPASPLDEDPTLPEQPPRPKKKSKVMSVLKWVAVGAAGTVLGAVTMRQYDRIWPPEPRRRNDGDEGATAPMLNPAFGQLGGGPPMSVNILPPAFPTAPPAQAPAQANPSDLTLGELKLLVKRKQASQKARRNRLIEEEYWGDE